MRPAFSLSLLLWGLTGCFAGLDDHLLTSGGPHSTQPVNAIDLGGNTPSSDAGPQPPPPLNGCDDFSADAVGALPAGWTPTGGTWKVVANGAAHALEQDALLTTRESIFTAAPNDMTMTATVLPGSLGSYCVQARFVDKKNHYSFCVLNGVSYELFVLKNLAPTTLAKGTHTVNITQAHTLTIQVKGSQINGEIDGVVVATGQDSTFASGGAALAADNIDSFSPVCVNTL